MRGFLITLLVIVYGHLSYLIGYWVRDQQVRQIQERAKKQIMDSKALETCMGCKHFQDDGIDFTCDRNFIEVYECLAPSFSLKEENER